MNRIHLLKLSLSINSQTLSRLLTNRKWFPCSFWKFDIKAVRRIGISTYWLRNKRKSFELKFSRNLFQNMPIILNICQLQLRACIFFIVYIIYIWAWAITLTATTWLLELHLPTLLLVPSTFSLKLSVVVLLF